MDYEITEEMVEAGLNAACDKGFLFSDATMDDRREAIKAAYIAMEEFRRSKGS